MKKIVFVNINFFLLALVAANKKLLLRQTKTCLFEEKIQNFHLLFSSNVSDEMFSELRLIFDGAMLTTNSYQEW